MSQILRTSKLKRYINLYVSLFLIAISMLLSSALVKNAVPVENQNDFFKQFITYTMVVIPLILSGWAGVVFSWLFYKTERISIPLNHDLQYVGLYSQPPVVNDDNTNDGNVDPQTCEACIKPSKGHHRFTFGQTKLPTNDFMRLGLVPPTPNLKPYNRFIAFFNYGTYSLFKHLHNNESAINDKGYISPSFKPLIDEKAIHILVYKTISISNKIIKKQKLNLTVNPSPLAAYLFRLASLYNNPQDKNLQQAAILFWKAKKDLNFTYKMRDKSYESLIQLSELPESWITETLEK